MKHRFAFRRYRLPLRVAVRTAHGTMAEREGVLVRLESENGDVGYGDAAPLAWFGTESVEEVAAACAELGGTVDEERVSRIPRRLGCLRAAVAMARAAMAKEPAERRAEERESYLQVAALLPAGRAVLDAIGPRADAGFRVFKWKVGVGEIADEIALLDDVCARLPDGAKLRLDANGAWDRRRAERWLERCAERPVEFVEQPVFAGAAASEAERRRADDWLMGLAEDFPTPIALDESLVGDADVERWAEAEWRGVYVIKPSLIGDIGAALARLEKRRARVVFSSALETAVGARAALRWALAWGGERRAIGFGVWPLFADGRFDGPATAPFLRREDVERINVEAAWNALS